MSIKKNDRATALPDISNALTVPVYFFDYHAEAKTFHGLLHKMPELSDAFEFWMYNPSTGKGRMFTWRRSIESETVTIACQYETMDGLKCNIWNE